jgi:hypothetical protein
VGIFGRADGLLEGGGVLLMCLNPPLPQKFRFAAIMPFNRGRVSWWAFWAGQMGCLRAAVFC